MSIRVRGLHLVLNFEGVTQLLKKPGVLVENP